MNLPCNPAIAQQREEPVLQPNHIVRAILEHPEVKVRYFPVAGSNTEEVRKSLFANGPVDNFGVRRAASTNWKIEWSWPVRTSSKAGQDREPTPQGDFSKTVCKLNLEVNFPVLDRRQNATSAAREDHQLDKQWEKFLVRLAKHERRHINIALNNYSRVCDAIKRSHRKNPNLTIPQAHAIGKRELNRIRALDRDYDLETGHGKSEGVVF